MENLAGHMSEKEQENACSYGNQKMSLYGGFQKNSSKLPQKEGETFISLKSKGFAWEFMWLAQKRYLLQWRQKDFFKKPLKWHSELLNSVDFYSNIL